MVEVDNKKVQVEDGLTIIQACKKAGVEIPRFCYHERLSIAGNCRMCLVEVEKSIKPVASCAMPVAPNMKIFTDTVLVKKAREGVMEMLLANHPLDCPICDQGGECDLQDQAMVFGNDRGRFYEKKWVVIDKDCGPLVKTIMTRCIHCTRCVRFASEIAGVGEFGVTGRGNSMEIGTYIKNIFISEVSGNVIDLCPVGALTSKPYAFVGRPWELRKVETVDVTDGMGANITVCVRGNELMRILPVLNESVNEEWITDKTRFSYDGLRRQRLTKPLVKWDGKFVELSWEEAFSVFLRNVVLWGGNIDVILGNDVELETAVLVKDLCNQLGEGTVSGLNSFVDENIDFRQNYLFNSGFEGVKETDVCLLIGVNLRLEMPLLAVRLRKEQRERGLLIGSIGSTTEYYFEVSKFGHGGHTLIQFLEGRHILCSKFVKAKKPMIIVGMYSMDGENAGTIRSGLENLKNYTNLVTKDWNGINMLHLGSNSVGLYDLGLKRVGKTQSKVLYLVNADDLEVQEGRYEYIIYQGHHGDTMAVKADLILPGASVIEKEGLYVNVEGRLQEGKFIFSAPGNAWIDWQILRGLLEYTCEKPLRLHANLDSVRDRVKELVGDNWYKRGYATFYSGNLKKGFINKVIYNSYISNYYMTDSITRSSKVMAVCTERVSSSKSNYRWK